VRRLQRQPGRRHRGRRHLDLGGRTVTCADTNLDDDVPQGIVLLGKKSKVMNGTVIGCTNGIAVGGTGKHLVQAVTSQGSTDDGFDVAPSANKNKFIDITGTGNASDGMQIDGDKNKITNAVMTGNQEDGIDLSSSADKNKLTNPRVENNADSGIEIGGDKNKVKTPTVSGNGAHGVDFGGKKNKITGGSSQGNGELDVRDCGGNKLKGFTFTTSTPDCQ
jgi:hypothetical protein